MVEMCKGHKTHLNYAKWLKKTLNNISTDTEQSRLKAILATVEELEDKYQKQKQDYLETMGLLREIDEMLKVKKGLAEIVKEENQHTLELIDWLKDVYVELNNK